MARASSQQVLSVLRAVLPEVVEAVAAGEARLSQVVLVVTCPACRRDGFHLDLAATRAKCGLCGHVQDPIRLPLFRPEQLSARRRREAEEQRFRALDQMMRRNRPVDIGRAVVGRSG